MTTYTLTNNSDNQIFSDNPETIYALGGNDQIDARGGNDTIDGGSGDDILTGGLGLDTLTGGTGADTFRDTMAGLNGDHITDLSIGDSIEITDLTTPNFAISGNTITYGPGSADFITVDGLGPGRFIIRSLTGGGYELHLQSPAENDFNGDGISDVLWLNDNGTLTDWLGTSNGSFTTNWANANTTLPGNLTIVGTGDFNGDGHPDILLRDTNGTITNWLSTSGGGFIDNSANSSNFAPTSWTVVGTGDFNADGHDDILWRDTSGALTDWLGTANGGFSNNWSNAGTSVPTNWTVVGTGDFNGDGSADILWRDSTGIVTDWLATETSGFTTNWGALSTGVPLSWSVAGTGDFNGDGITDVLWRNTDGTLVDWLGDSNGGFTANWAHAPSGVGPEWTIAAIGDFNGDAQDDILWRNSNGQVTEWLGTTNGGFTDNSATASTSVATAWHVHDPFL